MSSCILHSVTEASRLEYRNLIPVNKTQWFQPSDSMIGNTAVGYMKTTQISLNLHGTNNSQQVQLSQYHVLILLFMIGGCI
jgi:hypothetical protein